MAEDFNIPDVCQVTPVQAFMSTNLNNKTKSYQDLATKILRTFGWPAISVTELHQDVIFQNISTAIEFYTKYAGFTEECLIFDSNIYERGKGLRIDQLCTIAKMENFHNKNVSSAIIGKDTIDHNRKTNKDVYVTLKEIPVKDYTISDEDAEILMENCKYEQKEVFCMIKDYKRTFPDGIEQYSVIDDILYRYLIDNVYRLDGSHKYTKDDFKKSKDKRITCGGEEVDVYSESEKLGKIRSDIQYQNSYDYDIMDYRKVRSVIDYREGSSNTMTSLFSFESSLAASAYLTYQFSLRGFDMTTFYAMHEWRNTREKMLCIERDFIFDHKSQYFRLTPEPKLGQRYFGIITCYVERPIRELIDEIWIYEYALALCKIVAGRVRSRWGDSTSLPGGGVITGNVLLEEGKQEKKDLEEKLINQKGFGDWFGPPMIIG